MRTVYHTVQVWRDPDLQDAVDVTTEMGTFLIVVDDKLPPNCAAGSARISATDRLNLNLYVKVLTPRGTIGWVHTDNCQVLS